MHRPSSRRTRPAVERLESLDLLSGVASAAYVNLIGTPAAVDAKTYLTASTPSQGRQGGTINALIAVPATGYIAGVATIEYRVKIVPAYVFLFSPTVTFAMHVSFTAPVDNPKPGNVTVTYTKNVVPFGASVRNKVAQGIVSFIRRDGLAINSALGLA